MILQLGFLILCTVVDTGSISSSNASYDGTALVLKGQVVLDHGLGKMQAEEAILQKQEANKDFPFSVIHLNRDVLVKLTQHGQLQCDKAELDFSNLQGTLSSANRASYTDTLKKKKGKQSPLQILASTFHLKLIKKGETPKPVYDIQNIVAEENVALTYDTDYTLFTDSILYQIEGAQSHIVSQGKDRCKLIHLADTIEASRFDLDIVHNKLTLSEPQGVLPSFSKGEVRFSSETLLWDHDKNILVLKGNPHVSEPALGTLESDQEIHFFQKEKQLIGFKSYGKTALTYLNEHKLISNGTLTFDREKHIGTVESSPDQQLYYQEGEMGILADKAHIEYTEEENRFNPISIALKGRIKISSLASDHPARFGLADRLTYIPTTRTFILGADTGKKVLFVNAEDNLQLSAQEVHITQDPLTKKQTVKGIGNVQLALSAEEETLLKKIFGSHATATP